MPKLDKIIFLDIDGVLNCEEAYRSGECQYTEWIWEDGRKDHYQRFCSWSKDLMNKLIRETGAKIVISSTWRHSGIEFMRKVWEMEEMEDKKDRKKELLEDMHFKVEQEIPWRDKPIIVAR
jgi:hypothetical protein